MNSKPTKRPVCDDLVLEIPVMEQSYPIDEIIITTCLLVSGKLDTTIVHHALSELVQRWPVLGSRIRRGANGRLELRQPQIFSGVRPAFVFTSEEHQHPFPQRPSRDPTRMDQSNDFLPYFRTSATPRGTEDLLNVDSPILHVHINGFTDTTCVGLCIPHSVADLLGVGIILRALCSLLVGDMTRVTLPPTIDIDPIASFGEPYPVSKVDLERFRRNMVCGITLWNIWGKLRFHSRWVWELFLHQEESRLVFIPQTTVDRVRKEALDRAGIRVSDNDAVSAILTKIHLFNRPSSSQRLAIAFTANLRGRIPTLPSIPIYIRSALVSMCTTGIPIRVLQRTPAADIAIHIRKAVISQSTEEQLSKITTVFREMARRRSLPANHPPGETNLYITSWAAAKLSELDFSGAALRQGGNAGNVLFVGGHAAPHGMLAGRSRWYMVLGKVPETEQGEAGYWCDVGALSTAWPNIQKYMSHWSDIPYDASGYPRRGILDMDPYSFYISLVLLLISIAVPLFLPVRIFA